MKIPRSAGWRSWASLAPLLLLCQACVLSQSTDGTSISDAQLAAIVPGAEGPVFIKLAGPKDHVGAIKDRFLTLAKSPFKE